MKSKSGGGVSVEMIETTREMIFNSSQGTLIVRKHFSFVATSAATSSIKSFPSYHSRLDRRSYSLTIKLHSVLHMSSELKRLAKRVVHRLHTKMTFPLILLGRLLFRMLQRLHFLRKLIRFHNIRLHELAKNCKLGTFWGVQG